MNFSFDRNSLAGLSRWLNKHCFLRLVNNWIWKFSDAKRHLFKEHIGIKPWWGARAFSIWYTWKHFRKFSKFTTFLQFCTLQFTLRFKLTQLVMKGEIFINVTLFISLSILFDFSTHEILCRNFWLPYFSFKYQFNCYHQRSEVVAIK